MREELHEKLRHTSGYKQFALYRQRMPELYPFTPLHWHSEFEINFIVSGCADYIVGDEKFTSQPGTSSSQPLIFYIPHTRMAK